MPLSMTTEQEHMTRNQSGTNSTHSNRLEILDARKKCPRYVPNRTSMRDNRGRYVRLCDVGGHEHQHALHGFNIMIPSGILQRYELYLCGVRLQTKLYCIACYETTRRRKHGHRIQECMCQPQREGPHTNPPCPQQ